MGVPCGRALCFRLAIGADDDDFCVPPSRVPVLGGRGDDVGEAARTLRVGRGEAAFLPPGTPSTLFEGVVAACLVVGKAS